MVLSVFISPFCLYVECRFLNLDSKLVECFATWVFVTFENKRFFFIYKL